MLIVLSDAFQCKEFVWSHMVPNIGLICCSEYGFAEKVVEGMFIIVNSITIKIHSKAFHASFELWQLQGYSVNPNWQQSDLRLTRITDPHRGEVTALTLQEERMAKWGGLFRVGLILKDYYSSLGDFLK